MHHDIDSNEKDSSQQLLPEIADYAEVNPNTMSTFLKDRELSSPAPYATTTLVSNSSSRNVKKYIYFLINYNIITCYIFKNYSIDKCEELIIIYFFSDET